MIFPKEWFASHIDLPFEDTTMRCPVGYKEYLTQQFGDYMQYPRQLRIHDDIRKRLSEQAIVKMKVFVKKAGIDFE